MWQSSSQKYALCPDEDLALGGPPNVLVVNPVGPSSPLKKDEKIDKLKPICDNFADKVALAELTLLLIVQRRCRTVGRY